MKLWDLKLNMIRVGIIGGIGSGKSFISRLFGYPVFNADNEVKYIYKKNKECFNKLKKLIWEGPKYLFPLIDGEDTKSFSTFLNDPEKLLHVAFSFNIFSIVIFDKQL